MLKNKKNRLLNSNAQIRKQKKTNSKKSQRFLTSHKQYQKNKTNYTRIINCVIEFKTFNEFITHKHTHAFSHTTHNKKICFKNIFILSPNRYRRKLFRINTYFLIKINNYLQKEKTLLHTKSKS